VRCWRGYLSGARCRLAYGPADATATHSLTVSCFSKIQIGLPFWYRLTWVVPEKEGPLNVCVCVCVCVCVRACVCVCVLYASKYLFNVESEVTRAFVTTSTPVLSTPVGTATSTSHGVVGTASLSSAAAQSTTAGESCQSDSSFFVHCLV